MPETPRTSGNRTRIVHLASPETSATISAKYAQALVEGGGDVRLHYTNPLRAREFESALVTTRAPRRYLPLGRRRWLHPAFYLRHLELTRADTVIAEDPELLAFSLPYVRRSGARLVYMPFEYYPGASYATTDLSARWSEIERRAAPHVSSWVVLGDKIADLYADRLAPREAVHVVYNGLPRMGPVQDPVLRRRLGVGPEIKLVIYQGSVLEKRGLWDALEAMKLLPPWIHLVVLGMGELDRLRTDAEAGGIGKRVHVLDAVPHRVLLDYTRGADLGLIPIRNTCASYDLCSPAKLFEFVASGLPVAVSRLRQLEWFVDRHDIGGVFELECPESMARAILTLLGDAGRLNRCRERVRELQANEVCWEIQSEKLRRAVLARPEQDLSVYSAAHFTERS